LALPLAMRYFFDSVRMKRLVPRGRRIGNYMPLRCCFSSGDLEKMRMLRGKGKKRKALQAEDQRRGKHGWEKT
jgi:hypothetical protein